jgi:hypothetical protein
VLSRVKVSGLMIRVLDKKRVLALALAVPVFTVCATGLAVTREDDQQARTRKNIQGQVPIGRPTKTPTPKPTPTPKKEQQK